ncbi:hypothetical protein ACH5RR_010693 [Cinchona calisaya]|uniref:EID1-like F-box protein 3 n=1 Tax=Cinchona calisaya TaxID=153742 RepID=A0ABD3AJP2_9GENT
MDAVASPSQRQRLNPFGSESSNSDDSGILNERILVLVFQSIKWDIHIICRLGSVCRKLRAVAKRLLWKELCAYRAPRMIATLRDGSASSSTSSSGQMGGGWDALAKVLFFCCGCHSTRHFRVRRSLVGHLTKECRFSKTSGRSFLINKCRNDVLYVSDPCEHRTGEKRDGDDLILGIYRGVFRGFMKSMTRACLIKRQVELEEGVRCPYCGARVWSMTAARLIPKSAERRLGSRYEEIEYFVCVNGHLHGTCWLVPLSSDEDDLDEDLDGE